MVNYINTINESYPWTEASIKAANPDTSFPLPFKPSDEFKVVFQTQQPEYNSETQRVQEGLPVLTSKGHYEQTWNILDLTEEEIQAKAKQARDALVASTQQVTMRQARLVLHRNGYLSSIEAIIDSLPEPAKSEARIEWDYSSEVQKDKPLVKAIAAALNLSEDAIDDLFIEAYKL